MLSPRKIVGQAVGDWFLWRAACIIAGRTETTMIEKMTRVKFLCTTGIFPK
jgi:hypothetical protein